MTQYNYSLFPDQIDGYSQLRLLRDGVDEIVARDNNALRDAVVKIESELGVSPSGSYTTVRARLDSIGDASASIAAHLADLIDAHDASAISILDTADKYVSANVEDALSELAAVLPEAPNVVGEAAGTIPNTGVPNVANSGTGSLFLFNISNGTNILKKTQPVLITGLHVVEIGSTNGTGTTAQIKYDPATSKVQWCAPGDSLGVGVDVSTLTTGQVVTVASADSTKKIRIARSSGALPVAVQTENFEVLRLNAKAGYFTIDGTGMQSTGYVTRTSASATDTSRSQFVIGGIVYPADKGTLVLQRKLRGDAEFNPIAVLDLDANFVESLRSTGQVAYVPTLANYDTITLFDRYPIRMDYEELNLDADGNQAYTNFDVNETFPMFQVAKYAIPASNPDLVGGTLEAATDTTAAEIDDVVSAYRLIHYHDGITDFNGDPDVSDIYSINDSIGGLVSNGDNNVRASNVFVDTNTTRPNLDAVVLRPVVDAAVHTKYVSGIRYYNHEDDKFDLELRTKDILFANAYLKDDIIKFTSNTFVFPSSDGYGDHLRVTDLYDDGYLAYSDANPPDYTDTTKDHGFYLVNSVYNTTKRLYPDTNKFSTNAFISAYAQDPFGAGDTNDAYGLITSAVRLLVNSYDPYTSTDSTEVFVGEEYRNGTAETYTSALDPNQFTHNYGPSAGGYTLTIWDNTIVLSAGDLQVGGLNTHNQNSPGLVWPQVNYTTGHRPTQQAGTTYSAAGFSAVDATYQRLFSVGYPINAGKIRIKSSGDYLVAYDDIISSNASRPIKIELKIPGAAGNFTGWLDLGKAFQWGQLDDTDGCMTYVTGAAGDFTCHFTFGQRHAESGMIALRITYFQAQYADAKERIISYVGLEAED